MTRWAILLPILTLGCLGCNQSNSTNLTPANNKLIVAKLDTLPILQKDPDYEKLSQQYMVENVKLRQEMEQKLHDGTLAKNNAGEAYLQAQAKLNDRWMKSTNDFIQTRHSKMRQVVKELCEEKKIDMVLIDSKAYRTVAWGAFDITQDVLMKIDNSHAGSTSTPSEGTSK